MTQTYHLPFDNDNIAHNTRMQLRDTVRAAGGDSHVSPSFGHGTAFVVATLPEEVDPKGIFGEHPYILFDEEQSNDEPEEGAGDGAGEPDSEESSSEGTASEEAAPLGGDQGSAD